MRAQQALARFRIDLQPGGLRRNRAPPHRSWRPRCRRRRRHRSPCGQLALDIADDLRLAARAVGGVHGFAARGRGNATGVLRRQRPRREDRRRMRAVLQEQRIDEDRQTSPPSPSGCRRIRADDGRSPRPAGRRRGRYRLDRRAAAATHFSSPAFAATAANSAARSVTSLIGSTAAPRAFAIDRQPHRHPRPLAQPAADIHVAAVQPHQALDDRQAEAGAVVPAVVGRARLEEGLAQPRQVVLADADAGILDR